MTKRLKIIAILALALNTWGVVSPQPLKVDADSRLPRNTMTLRGFLEANCYACHNSQARKGDLDLTALKFDLADDKTFTTWVKVHDRVLTGEMPPIKAAQPDEASRAAFLKALAQPMIEADDARVLREGRAAWRRMNRFEYENTLRDLLGAPWLQVREMLPEDGEAFRFNKVGTALDVSHVQIARYLGAADYALHEVIATQSAQPKASINRLYAREQPGFAKRMKFTQFNRSPERATFPILGDTADVAVLEDKAPITAGAKNPKQREIEAMGVVASTYEPLEIRFDRFTAPASGRY